MLKEPVTNDDHIQGNEEALITFMEYGDYECPYCRQAYPIVKQIQEHFGPKLRFVFRNFALSEAHPMAEPAAQTAEYAATEGLFWEMHDLIYENQNSLSLELLFELTKSLGLSEEKLNEVLTRHAFEKKLQNEFLGGIRSGVNGTPFFFINQTNFYGPFSYENLVTAINKALIPNQKNNIINSI